MSQTMTYKLRLIFKYLNDTKVKRWVRFNVPLDTVQIISETMFYRSDDPTNIVKALKEGG